MAIKVLAIGVIALGAIFHCCASAGAVSHPDCSTRGEHFDKIRQLIDAVETIGKLDPPQLSDVYGVLLQLNVTVRSQRDVDDFRCQDSLQTIQSLISFARIEERTLRIYSSLLLANVVDNTTLCGVLNELSDHTLNDEARFNLWQVVKIVAPYARVENKAWTISTIAVNRAMLEGKPNFEKTLALILAVEQATQANQVLSTLKQDYAVQLDACLALPNIKGIGLAGQQ